MNNIYIDREELRKAYETMSVAEAMKHLGISHSKTLYRLLDEAGIARKDGSKAGNKKRYSLSE